MSTRLENAVTAENEYTAEQLNSEKPPRGHRLNRKKRKLIFIVVMLALPLIQLFIFWFLVNVNTIIMAFQEFDWSSGKDSIILSAYFARLAESRPLRAAPSSTRCCIFRSLAS